MEIYQFFKGGGIILLIILLSITNYSAIVSDNDGSAFITKAEFDTLKNDFQARINYYYGSLDSKIDGAIAEYLAGINISKIRAGYLNTLAKTQCFGDGLNLYIPALGNKIYGYFNIGCFVSKVDLASSLTQLQHLTGKINAPAWKWAGNDYGYYLIGEFYDDDENPTQFVLNEETKTYYQAAVTGIMTSGAYAPKGTAGVPLQNIFTKKDIVNSTPLETIYHETTGIYADKYFIDLALNNIEAAEKENGHRRINVIKAWSFVDEKRNVDTNILSGRKLDNKDYYFVKSTELAYLGDDVVNSLIPDAAGREVQASGIGWDEWYATSFPASGWFTQNYLEIYSHKYKKIKLSQLVNAPASNICGETVMLYGGLPVYDPIESNEHIKIKFKFENTDGADTYFVVKKNQFNDEDISTTHQSEIKLGNTLKASSGQIITFEIDDLLASEILFIKARPVSGKTTITTESLEVS